MIRVNVINTFRDKYTNKVHLLGTFIKISSSRLKELENASKEYGFDFVEVVDEKNEGNSEEVVEVSKKKSTRSKKVADETDKD